MTNFSKAAAQLRANLKVLVDQEMSFDAGRVDSVRRHLGYGAGIHMCFGMHSATLEIERLIAAMI